MTQKLDKLIYGLILGMLLPVLGSFIFFGVKNSSFVWGTMLSLAKEYPSTYLSYLKIGAILNLIPFFICNNFYMQRFQQGIIFGTIFWLVILVLFYFFGN